MKNIQELMKMQKDGVNPKNSKKFQKLRE